MTVRIDGIDTIELAIEVVEVHLHSRGIWFGAAAVPSGEEHVADTDSMTEFVADAGNDDWGTWLQVLGSTDTPVETGKTMYDAHRLFIKSVEVANTLYRIQLGCGASGAAALSAGTFTEEPVSFPANARQSPIHILDLRADSGTKCWVRVWADGANTGTVTFLLGLHEYDR